MSCYRTKLAALNEHDLVAFEYRARTIFWKTGDHYRLPEWVNEGRVARGKHCWMLIVMPAYE